MASANSSLSARRAWIEIDCNNLHFHFCLVALRKESVDRNNSAFFIMYTSVWSLSARRAWIEIAVIRRAVWAYYVALRKESVDRNITRGQLPTPEPPSLSARRAWIEIRSQKPNFLA